MADNVNIREVIDKSTSQVDLDDLSRKGVRKVKVLNQASISRLIAEAVDRVLRARKNEITGAERDRIIQESRQHFEGLAREELKKQKQRAEELEAVNRSMQEQIESLRQQCHGSQAQQEALDGAMEKLAGLSKIEEDQAAARDALESKEKQLQGLGEKLAARAKEVAAQEGEVARREEELRRREAEVESARQAVASQGSTSDETREKLEAEAESLRNELAERERFLARLEGELNAKNDEIARLGQGGGDPDVLKQTLEGIQKSIATLGRGGGGGGSGSGDVDTDTLLKFVDHGDDVSMETNVSEVKVNQKKSAGVNSSLAKLKKLNKGV